MKHYNGLEILSYNAIFNFVISNRNYGKTWNFKKRAFKRALKYGTKTLWVRTFTNEVKEASRNFYSSIDLQKFCGITPYNPKTKKGNFKQEGNIFYVRRNNKWTWFLQIVPLSKANSMRSADDVKIDTIIYDEFTTTEQKLKLYRGNQPNDFIDLWVSAKREHEVKCIFLGNKENILNLFFNYFNIPALPLTYEGIRTFRNGSIAVQQINNLPKETNDYDKKVKDLLIGTSYGAYLYDSVYKNQINLKTRKTPTEATEYIQLCINGYELKISVLNGFFYVSNKIDTNRKVYTLEVMNKYRNERLLVKRQKQLFLALVNALADKRVYYNALNTYEAIQPFYRWCGV